MDPANLSKEEKDSLISQFCSVAGESVDIAEAQEILTYSSWNLEAALSNYYAGGFDDGEQGKAPEETPAQSGGPRYLDGRPAPTEASSSTPPPASSSRGQISQRGVRTFRDLQGASSSHGHDHDDGDDDDDDASDKDQDFFTGGEKSGLAVQNPGRSADPSDVVGKILKRAQRNTPRIGGDEPPAPSSHFRGAGQTLGGDDAPSRLIPDPNAGVSQPPSRVTRELHLWQDGFSVDDGELYRYDDPENRRYLEIINQGHAPLSILNVEHDQEVDVTVVPHKDEKYVAPKKKYKPFSDQGRRLGSPAPGISGASSSSTTAAEPASSSSAAATSSSTSAAAAAAPTVDVDSSKPVITLQIRLGDGTRLVSRFNETHTIGDVYAFVNASSPASTQRGYALMTTFPSKELADKGIALGDMAEFKRGGTVVQKWT